MNTQTYDISENGASVQLTTSIAVGASVGVRLELPGTARSIKATGEIRWVDGKLRAGLEFLRMSRSDQELLQQWVGDQLQSTAVKGWSEGPAFAGRERVRVLR